MKIVICTQGLPFDGDTIKNQSLGGSETAVLCVARELAKMKHDVTVYNLTDQEGIFDGVEYINIDRWQDFVECGYADIAIVSRFVQMYGEKLNTKLNILWNHDILPDEMKNILISLTWNIDYMYCLSEYHKEQYLKQIPEIEPIVKLNTNGIDTSIVPKRTEKKHQIMFTSRPERGLYDALHIYESLNDKDLDFIICNYKTLDNEEVMKIEEICAQKIQELVNEGFSIGVGSFPKEELYKHISESKAVIYPTEFPEISCISAMEAQACGTVFITTDGYALKETVAYKGISFDDNYNANFVLELVKVLNDEAYRKKLENKGLKHSKQYTWKKVAEKFIADALEHFDKRSEDVDGIIDRLVYESDIVQAREMAKLVSPDRVPELDKMLRHLDSPEEQKKIYEDETTHERIDLPFSSFDKAGRFIWVSKRVGELKIDNVLDFACHMGASSIKISNDNPECKVRGYDLSDSALSKATQRIDMHAKNKDNVTFSSDKPEYESYDAVFNGEMLEHVLNPEEMVDELEKYVKKGGKMFITVPKGAWESLSRRENEKRDVVYHVNRFDALDIDDMFGKKKDLKVLVLPNTMTAMYGEKLGNYMIEYTVDGTPTGERCLARKMLTTRPHQSISCCIIGKDAEKSIEQLLDSLKDSHGNMIPDEIILADDSVNNFEMANRAMKYGVKVVPMPHSICAPDYWGFANARNFSVSESKGKWILWIDTDEIARGLEFARKYLECPLQEAFVVKQYHPQRDNYIEADVPQRIYRRDCGQFYGFIHEQAQKDINNPIFPSLVLSDAEIWNMGSALEADRLHKAMERNLPLLDKDWKENVLAKKKNGEQIRKLTPILVIRDLFNRMQQVYATFGTYRTREVEERILPRIMELYLKWCKDEKEEIYKSLSDKVMQDVYHVLNIGHKVDVEIDGKKISKIYVDINELMEDIKKL